MTDADESADGSAADSSSHESAGQDASNGTGGEQGDGATGGENPPALPPWKNPAYRFVFLFLVYLGGIAYGYPIFRERYVWLVDAMATFTARVEYHIFSIFSSHVTISKQVVAFKGFAVHIIEECTGVYEVLIFAAAVLAFPTIWAKKGVGLGLGVPLLYLFNVIRIAVLMLVGRYAPEYFDFMHLYFWQATLILMITSVWLLWITQVVNRDWSRSAAGT
jgi:archaeosortase B (VPXXXP-CTERM-specific)